MHCDNCGSEVDEKDVYCGNCGHRIEKTNRGNRPYARCRRVYRRYSRQERRGRIHVGKYKR